MAELRTEEEQLDAIKRWWKENGTSLVAGVALAVAGVVGWNAWQGYQENQATAASMRYQQLVTMSAGDALDDATLSEARQLADEIVEEHGNTLYAGLAQLLDASLALQQDDRDAAQAALRAVIERDGEDYLAGLARLRLARLQIAEGDAEAALATLEENVPEALAAQRADVRGDAYQTLARKEEARDAWRSAMALAEQQGQPLYGVELKLDNLGFANQDGEEATL